MKTLLYNTLKKSLCMLLAAAVFNAAAPSAVFAQEITLKKMQTKKAPDIITQKGRELVHKTAIKDYGYGEYNKVFADASSAPEYKLSPKQLYKLIDSENKSVVDSFLNDKAYLREQAQEYVETGAFVCFSVIGILMLAAAWAPAGSVVSTKLTSFYAGGSLLGTAAITAKQANIVFYTTVAIEFAVVSYGMHALYPLYFKFSDRVFKYKKSQDINFVKTEESLADAYKKADSCDNMQPSSDLAKADKWNDPEIHRGAVVMLYGLRYINSYMRGSTEPMKYEMGLAEYLQLITVIPYKTSEGVTIEPNFGTLFSDEERTQWRKFLLDMKTFEIEETKKLNKKLTKEAENKYYIGTRQGFM
ncbi:hypothetical protein Dip510_000116 [Elusimicrobium posterum]|uniref:hypothetical protein n=1 Tax=Elusimicrobium posterum TaxID=3116653 RepID=UPI003C78E9EC